MAIEEGPAGGELTRFPGFVSGQVPQYSEYHEDVDFLDELEAIWGERWGAQGIGRLRKVAMTPPLEVEVLPIYEREPAFFLYGGRLPDLAKMREQHAALQEVYRGLGIEVLSF
jgi:hypothetical protein